MSGAELITAERGEHFTKHDQSVRDDYYDNDSGQLPAAAMWLIDGGIEMQQRTPLDWDQDRWLKMVRKSYKERLIIAGALLAAEIDRLQYDPGE